MKTQDVQILLVDDERDILEILEYNLSKEGYQINTAGNGKEAIQKAIVQTPDLIILDLMMPGMDGIETCKKLRRVPELHNTIITFLTARSEDQTEMEGYHAGADDYITKPIRPKVLVSKVKALLRRLEIEDDNNLVVSNELIIDKNAYQVTYKGQVLNLPRKEFKLLYFLAIQSQKVHTRNEILKEIWGEAVVVGDRTVDVHIRKLREKIGKDKIKTVKGVGYKYIG